MDVSIHEDVMKQAAYAACNEYTDFATVLVSSVPYGFRGREVDTKIALFHADFGTYSFNLILPPIRCDDREMVMGMKAGIRRLMDKFVADSVKWYGSKDS
jgi:hypothetical protein